MSANTFGQVDGYLREAQQLDRDAAAMARTGNHIAAARLQAGADRLRDMADTLAAQFSRAERGKG